MRDDIFNAWIRLTNGLSVLVLLLVCVTAAGNITRVGRNKRGLPPYYTDCPDSRTRTAGPGETCVRVYWSSPSAYSNIRPSQRSGHCFSHGDYQLKYGYRNLFLCEGLCWCKFWVRARVYYCTEAPSNPNGTRQCTGQSDHVYGSVCTYTCNAGFEMQGSAVVVCQKPDSSSTSVRWSGTLPSCHEIAHAQEGEQKGLYIPVIAGGVAAAVVVVAIVVVVVVLVVFKRRRRVPANYDRPTKRRRRSQLPMQPPHTSLDHLGENALAISNGSVDMQADRRSSGLYDQPDNNHHNCLYSLAKVPEEPPPPIPCRPVLPPISSTTSADSYLKPAQNLCHDYIDLQ